jgi:hypothetical protein
MDCAGTACLEALRVVRVLDGACRTRGAGSRAGVTNTAALVVLGDSGSGVATSGRSRASRCGRDNRRSSGDVSRARADSNGGHLGCREGGTGGRDRSDDRADRNGSRVDGSGDRVNRGGGRDNNDSSGHNGRRSRDRDRWSNNRGYGDNSGRGGSSRGRGDNGDASNGLGAGGRNRTNTELTSDGNRRDGSTRRNIRLGVRIVQVVDEARVRVRVGLLEVDASAKSDRARRDDLELNALHVQLYTTGRVDLVCSIGLVESDDLGAEEVLASRKIGDGDGDVALVGNELVGRLYASLVSSKYTGSSQIGNVPIERCKPRRRS